MRYFLLLTTMLMSTAVGAWAQTSEYTASGHEAPVTHDPAAPHIDEPDAQKLVRGDFSYDSLKWNLRIDDSNRIQSNMTVDYQLGTMLYQFPLEFPNPIRWNEMTKQFEADAIFTVERCQYPARLTFSAYKTGTQSELDIEVHYAQYLYAGTCTSSGDQGHRFTFVRAKSTMENLVGVIHYTGGFLFGSAIETKDTRAALLIRLAVPKFCKDVEISEVSTLQGTQSKPATLVDASTNTYEINGKEGLVLSGVKVSLNGPPHQECDIPVYASFVVPGRID